MEERIELRMSSCNTTGPTKRLVSSAHNLSPASSRCAPWCLDHPLKALYVSPFVSPKVRVFTFSVGQHNYDVTPLQWIACTNKGELSFRFIDLIVFPISHGSQSFLSDILPQPFIVDTCQSITFIAIQLLQLLWMLANQFSYTQIDHRRTNL